MNIIERKLRRIVALVVTICMLVALMPNVVSAASTYLDFGDGTVSNNTVTYTVGQGTATLVVPNSYTISEKKITVEDTAMNTLISSIEVNGFNPSNMEVYIQETKQENPFQCVLNVDSTYKLSVPSGNNLPNSAIKIGIRQKSNDPSPSASRFSIKVRNGDKGVVKYKENVATTEETVSSSSQEQNISLDETKTYIITATPLEGYTFDQGQTGVFEAGQKKSGFSTDSLKSNGWTVNYPENNDNNIEVIIEFRTASGGEPDNNQSNQPFSVSLGQTELQDNTPVSDENGGTLVKNGNKIVAHNYDGHDKVITLVGSGEMKVEGFSAFQSIQLNEANIEVSGSSPNETSELIVATVEGKDTRKSEIRFRDDLKVSVGYHEDEQSGNKVVDSDYAFKNLKVLRLESYNFHDRDPYYISLMSKNEVIVDVDDVYIENAKVKAISGEGHNVLDNNSNLTFFQEGQLSYKGNLGGKNVKSKYYKNYPGGTESLDNIDQQIDNYVDYENIDVDSSTKATYTYNSSLTIANEGTFKHIASKDPILYSIQYRIDENDDEAYTNADKGTVTMSGFEKGFFTEYDGTFEAWIAAGEEVNVTILPDKGYQYTKNTLCINGQVIDDVDPNAKKAEYKFVMPHNAGHMYAGFTKTSDIVNVDDNLKVTSASISNTDKVINNGNAKLVVSEAKPSTTQQTAMTNVATAGASLEYLELDVSEAVVKNYDANAKTQSTWDEALHDLKDDVSITLKLDSTHATDANYEIIRDHNGEVSKIDSTYDATTNTITFKSNKFSTYAIATTKAATPVVATTTTTTPVVDFKAVGDTVKATNGATVTLLKGDVVSLKNKNVKKASVSVPSKVVVNGKTYKVTTLKGDAFNGNYVKKVTLPSSITKLNAKTFAGDVKLTSITINSKKLTVSKTAFKGLKKKQLRKIKVTVNKKNMTKKNFNALKKQLVKAGLKASNIKRK